MTDIQKEDVKWEEQVVAGSAEDNIFMQEFIDPKLSASDSVKGVAAEPSIDELPKPAPRYGHAACKYQGLLYIRKFLSIKARIFALEI